MSTGLIFLIIVFAAFFFFATQFGAPESKIGTGTMIALFFIVGIVLYALVSGVHVAVLK